MNAPHLIASRSTLAVDGLRETLRLFRNSANQYEFENTCLDSPEENFREVVSGKIASEFIMDPDTQMLWGVDAPNEQLDLGHVFTPKQLAARWSVSAATVLVLVESGQLSGFRVGPRLYRIRADEVRAYEARKAEAKPYKPRQSQQEIERALIKARQDAHFKALKASRGREKRNKPKK